MDACLLLWFLFSGDELLLAVRIGLSVSSTT
jgi:hypothetical protein